VFGLAGALTAPAAAQTIVLRAAAAIDVQRFSNDEPIGLLDGSSAGIVASGGVTFARHLVLSSAFSTGRSITNNEVFAIDVDGRSVSIASSMTHRTTSIDLMGGYTHSAGPGLRIAYLGGVALTRLSRRFTTDAARSLLVFPSNVAAASTETERSTPFVAPAAEVQVFIALRGRLWATTGVRLQTLRLDAPITGISVMPSGGLAWLF
jgi:hypothetical protein